MELPLWRTTFLRKMPLMPHSITRESRDTKLMYEFTHTYAEDRTDPARRWSPGRRETTSAVSSDKVDPVLVADRPRVLIRRIRPDDKAAFQALVTSLSLDSRRRRFYSAISELSDSALTYLTEVDFERHFAWVGIAVDEPGQPVVAEARYVRYRDRPDTAEFALLVADAYQRGGLGRCLLTTMASIARSSGVRCFEGLVLAGNSPMIRLLRSLGAQIGPPTYGVVEAAWQLDEHSLTNSDRIVERAQT